MLRLAPERLSFEREANRLLGLVRSSTHIEPAYRKLLAEIVSLRLADLLENHPKAVFCKLVCGVAYLDGSFPVLLKSCRSKAQADVAMAEFNRTKRRQPVWNDGSEIRENVANLIHTQDHAMRVMRLHASHLTEVRYLRNQVAHRNVNTRKNFRKIVERYYGAYLPGITCGTLLLSERVSKPALVETHILRSKVLLAELLKA